MKKIRVLLADDHILVLEGLRGLLEREFEIVGSARNGMEACSAVSALRPDVILLDISMPVLDGISAAQRIRKIQPDVRILFLTMHSDLPRLQEAFLSGASGFLLKTSSPEELTTAIREVARGRTYLSPAVSTDVVRDWLRSPRRTRQPRGLTSRNREVLKLVADGRSNKEIASLLNISVKTVEFHKSSMMRKLGLGTTADLVRFAAQHGIVE